MSTPQKVKDKIEDLTDRAKQAFSKTPGRKDAGALGHAKAILKDVGEKVKAACKR